MEYLNLLEMLKPKKELLNPLVLRAMTEKRTGCPLCFPKPYLYRRGAPRQSAAMRFVGDWRRLLQVEVREANAFNSTDTAEGSRARVCVCTYMYVYNYLCICINIYIY